MQTDKTMIEPYILIVFLLVLGVDLSKTNKIEEFLNKLDEQRGFNTNS